jgi:hypothetical protein
MHDRAVGIDHVHGEMRRPSQEPDPDVVTIALEIGKQQEAREARRIPRLLRDARKSGVVNPLVPAAPASL